VKEYTYVRGIADIVSLVQAGVLEFHPFGSQVDDIEHPDLMVFDLDPSPDVAWAEMLRATGELRGRIEALGLAAFLRTTGGKGLHIVVPLEPRADWDTVKAFAQAVSELHAKDDPTRLTTNMAKAKRTGKIFIDYLRNTRGATAIGSYSVRAREGAPIAVPVRWDEFGSALRPDRYNIGNIRRRLAALREDPWHDFIDARRPLDAALLKAVGLSASSTKPAARPRKRK
jgi:bifunctional non-homologous end joining protein LigD